MSEALAILAAYRAAGATAAMVLADWYAHGASTQGAVACRLGLTRRTVSSAVGALASAGCDVLRGSIVKPASHFVQSASQSVKPASQSEKRASQSVQSASQSEKPASHLHDAASHDARTGTGDCEPAHDARAGVEHNQQALNPSNDLDLEIGPQGPQEPCCEPAAAGEAPAKRDDLILLDPEIAPSHVHERAGEVGPPIRREPRPRRANKVPTGASEILRLWMSEYRARKGVSGTVTKGHAARLTALAKTTPPELAPAIVQAFFADPFATQAGHTLGVLAAAAVWDRVLLAAFERAPHLRPMPDPETATLDAMERHLAAMPEIVRIEVAGYRYEWEGQGKVTTGKILGRMIRAAVGRGIELGWFAVAP